MSMHKFVSLPVLILLFHHQTCYSYIEEDDPPTLGRPNGSLHSTSSYPTYIDELDGERGAAVFDRHRVFHERSIKSRSLLLSDGTVFSVDDYGATGDGTTDDTEAFEAAWTDACSSSDPAILLVPKNKTYLLKPIVFSGSCESNITVKIKGQIVAPANRSDWNSTNQRHWILFSKISNLTVTGGGTINGNGEIWWQNSCKVNTSLPCEDAPTAMTFYSCKNLTVEKLKMKNSQQIHISFEKSRNVVAANLTITAPSSSPNTDGIHVTRTRAIVISNCTIKTGDDCISIVSGSQNVKATRITCGPGHGISIGSLGANNSTGKVSRVTVDNAQLNGTENGARIKTWQGGSGYAKNIIFRNMFMYDVENPIIIDQNYCDSSAPCSTQESTVEVSKIYYENITGTSASEVAIRFNCSESIPCHGIVLQNIDLVRADGTSTISACQNANWTSQGSVVPTPCLY